MWRSAQQILGSIFILVAILCIPLAIEKTTSSTFLRTKAEITEKSAQSSEVLGAAIAPSTSSVKFWEVESTLITYFVGTLVIISMLSFVKYKIDTERI